MRALIYLSLPLLLTACGDKDDTGEDAADTDDNDAGDDLPSPFEVDDDGDGVTEAEGDCDDTDETVMPGADELCDGIDNDCDGTIDDGAGDMVTFYYDHDGDGAGNADDTIDACAAPAGTSEHPGDCDDLDADVHPEATETCNGIDDDCDALIDDADDSLDTSTHTDWTVDADEDGYGDATADPTAACDAPEGTVDNADDCDDTNAAVSPADAEVCDSADTDEDCDGLVNDDDPDIYVASQTVWYVDADEDGWGDADDAGLSLCEDPTTETVAYSVETDDCDDTDETTYPGAVEVCRDGVVNDCDGAAADAEEYCAWNTDYSFADADGTISEADGDFFSWFAATGDLDGDGTEDLVIGSAWSSEGTGSGRVYALYGPLSGDATSSDDVSIDAVGSDTFGVDPAVGDVDGDGYADLWVGAPGWDGEGNNIGAAYLIHGPLTSGTGADMASFSVTGEGDYDYVGTGQSIVGDQDGDGVLDLLGGASGIDDGANGAGVVYLYSGAETGDLAPSDALASITGSDSNEAIGQISTFAGNVDVNDDGVADLVIGTPRGDTNEADNGGVYVFHGPVSGALDGGDADAVIAHSDEDADYVGQSVVGGLDWDGDGSEDLAIGASGSDLAYDSAGALFVQLGPVTTDVDLSTDAALSVDGDEDDNLGGTAAVGDFDGDSTVDLLIGNGTRAMTSNSASYSSSNSAWILLGPASGNLAASDLSSRILGDEDTDGFGASVTALADQNGDGAAEALVFDRASDTNNWAMFFTPTY
jgi:hypothetical protein